MQCYTASYILSKDIQDICHMSTQYILYLYLRYTDTKHWKCYNDHNSIQAPTC